MTQSNVLAQVQLEGIEPCRWIGLHAEIDAIGACLRYAGFDASFTRLMGMTASALRTHFFRLQENPGLRLGPDPENPEALWGPRFGWSSLQHNNYGHFESIGHFFGADIRQVDGLDAVSTWKLLRFELDANRPVIASLHGDPLQMDIITGYRLQKAPLGQILHVVTPNGPIEIDITARKPEQEGAFPRSLILVRPESLAPHRASDDALQMGALRWALGHGRTRRELVYETQRFYATGEHAFEAFALFLRHDAQQELEEPIEADKDQIAALLPIFCRLLTDQWARARRQAALYFQAWSDDLRQSGREIEGFPDAANALGSLPEFYNKTAQALEEALAMMGSNGLDLSDANLRNKLADAIGTARQHELRTLEALAAVLN